MKKIVGSVNYMPTVEISDEVYRRVMAFKKVVDVVLGESLEKEEDYIGFVLLMGVPKLLVDPLPKNDLLRETMVAMFRENPEFVVDFIVKMLTKGQVHEEEEEPQVSQQWRQYIA